MSTKRIHHTQSHWQQLVEQQANSGLSGAAFCRQRDIRYANFMSWRKKLQTSKAESEGSPGPHADGSIPLDGPARRATAEQQKKNQ